MSRVIPGCKVSDVRTGAVLEADAGHTCIPEGERLFVHADNDGRHFVYCADGKHYLARHRLRRPDGSYDRYIGFSLRRR